MSMIHHSLISEALETFKIPTGDSLTVNEDGTFRFNVEADDYQQVMGALIGQIVADHVTAKMVIPSNVAKLKDVARILPEILTYRGMAGEDREEVEEVVEMLEGVIGNLDGCMVPDR